jgi:hypothetical protein
MSMRDLHISAKLNFDDQEEQSFSEDILLRVLGINCRVNLHYLKQNPNTPPLYESGVLYTPPDQADGRPPLNRGKLRKFLAIVRDMGIDPETALMIVRMLKGIEIFLGIPETYRRGKGDCNELVPIRIAELWRAGIAASPYLTWEHNERGGISYHCIVQWPDGSAEDPSLILGMGGKDRAADRAEEIRKNAERWSTYMAAAQQLIHAEGASPVELGRQIDLMGLAPRDGVFRSPYPYVGASPRQRLLKAA